MNAGVQDLADISESLFSPAMEASVQELLTEYLNLGGSDQVAKGIELERFTNTQPVLKIKK